MSPISAAGGLVHAPDAVASDARAWMRPVLDAAGSAVRALYVYGSALSPTYDPHVSDVNLLLIVRDLPFAALQSIARAMPDATKRSAGGHIYAPVILTEKQVKGSLDVFPIDYLDLSGRRALLDGVDVFADVEVRRKNLRHQCEFELRAKLVGMRQSFLRAHGSAESAHYLLSQAAGGSAALFRHLLTLRRETHPEAHEEVARTVARVYGVDADALVAPFHARREERKPDVSAFPRFGAYLSALEALIDAVDALPSE
jgi:hypothetical protein